MTNHYGVYVNRDEPTTGVYQNNKIPWLHEKLDDGIDLQFVEHIDNCEICQNGNEYCDITDNWEMGTVLIGSWKKDSDGLYEPDKTGEYAAICGEIYTQVVWSKTTGKSALCSPCYPGQCDIDTPGDYLYYALPADMLED